MDWKTSTASEILDQWKSSITSYLPSLFSITKDKLDNGHPKMFWHTTENGNGVKIISFTDEKELDVQKTKKSLLECEIQDQDIFAYTYEYSSKFCQV